MARRDFGSTWWGRAWLEALEQRAQLDPNRLPRGRTYARTGRVIDIGLRPGEIVASVAGRDDATYEVRVATRQFTAREWQRVLRAVAAKAGHAAALLDGELLPEVADDARAAGVDLLPGPGELRPYCSCPDWAIPCKHAAAVCYLAADELDADPFALLELRGLRRSAVLAELRRVRAAGATEEPVETGGESEVPLGSDGRTGVGAGRASGPTAGDDVDSDLLASLERALRDSGLADWQLASLDTVRRLLQRGGGDAPAGGPDTASAGSPVGGRDLSGADDLSAPLPPSISRPAPAMPSMSAREAWTREIGILPPVPHPPPHPGRPAPWPTDPPSTAPFTGEGLEVVATDAVARAWRQGRGEGRSELRLPASSDVARRAATLLAAGEERSPAWTALVRSSGRLPSDLRLEAAAWLAAREAGLRMLVEARWPAPVGEMLAAHASLMSAGLARRDLTVDGNRITIKSLGRQLRLGQDGRWYRFDKIGGRWQISGPPADEADELIDR